MWTWTEIARKWTELESVAAGIIGTAVTIVLIIIGRVMKFFRSRQADEALSTAREARQLARENRARIERNEKRVSDCYSIVISLQHDMAAMSKELDEMATSADELAANSRVVSEYSRKIINLVDRSGLSSSAAD